MDGSLRELERRARGTADAADVHAYLQALVRADAVPADRAPLLMWLAAEVPSEPDELARGLAEHGPTVVALGALAAAEGLLDVWRAHAPAEYAAGPEEALAATRAWLACPCAAHAGEAQLAAEASLAAGEAARYASVLAALDGTTEHGAPEDECDLDPLDPRLTRDPSAAFDDEDDAELLARLRRASDAGDPVDADLLEECRQRVGEEAALDATAGALREEVDEQEPPGRVAGWRRRDGADETELQALDRRTVPLLLVDPVATLAAAAAAACSAERLRPEDRGAILRLGLERATSLWTVPEEDWDANPDDELPLLLGVPLVDPAVLATRVLDALRRWAIELPPAAVPGLTSPSRSAGSRRRARAGDDAELPRDPTRLALLAWLGHPGAALRVALPPPPNDLEAWARGLARFGAAVCGRAALSTARAALDALEERTSRLPSGPRLGLMALEVWLDRPGALETEAARAALDARVDAMCESSGPAAQGEELAALALELALATGDRLADASAGVQLAGAEVVGPTAVRRAVARALVPSLLAAPGDP